MTRVLWPAVFGVALLVGMWITERRSQDRSVARKTYLFGVWGGFLGARAWFSAQYGLSSAGMSFWGFVMGATLAVVLYRRFHFGHWQMWDFPDAVAPALLLGDAVVRIGCFLHGCCYGKVCDLPWAVTFGPSDPAYHTQLGQGLIDRFAASSLPVHPTQLYEALFAAGLALLLINRGSRLPRHFSFLLAMALYAVFRFFLEFVRGDSGGAHVGSLTFAQATALGMLLASLGLMWWKMPVRTVAKAGGEAG